MKWRDSLASAPWLVKRIVTAFNVRGDVPQDMGSLLPSAALLDMAAPEYVVPGLGRLLSGRVTATAVGAQQGFAHLVENSLGAQVLAVVESITIINLAAATNSFTVGIAPVQGVYGTTGVVAARDGRMPITTVSTFLPTAGTAGAPAGVNGEGHAVAAGLSLTIPGPWVLASGQNQTLEVLSNSVNAAFTTSFRWRERPILRSESFVQ